MKNKSKIRKRICITDWAINAYYINPRKEFLDELNVQFITLTNEDLPNEITEQIEKFLLEKYEPIMTDKNQNKWKYNY